MAFHISEKYDHIDYDNGTDTLRHYLKDNDSAAAIEKIEKELAQESVTISLSWVLGTITSAGVQEDNSTRIRTPFIYLGDLEKVDVSVASGYQMSWLTYNAAKTVTAVQDWTTTAGSITAGENAVYVRFILAKTNSGATITPADGSNLTVTIHSKIQKQIADVEAYAGTKASVDGSYSGMTVGNAEQIVSTIGIVDKVPYSFRTAGGSAEIANREEDKLVGGTVCWNQILNPITSSGETQLGITRTKLDTGFRFAGTATSDYSLNLDSTVVAYSASHVYLLDGIKGGSSSTYFLRISGSSPYGRFFGDPLIFKPSSASSEHLSFRVAYGTTIDVVVTPQIFDLTAMFGSTIADYIYSLEEETAGAGVAWFKKLFPKSYYAYNTGELMSVQTSAHKTVGFNQWDEEWEVGNIATSSGVPGSSGTAIRSKNFCKIIGGATYYMFCGKTDGGNTNRYYVGIVFYDSDKNYISGSYYANMTFTAPTNAVYFKITTNTSTTIYGSTYNHDICINLSWDGERDGEYEPYKLNSYPLDSDLVLRGIPKLDGNNSLYYDGDTYEADGTVTRKYGVVDLGTLNWYMSTLSPDPGWSYFRCSVAGLMSDTIFGNNNALCSKFVSNGVDYVSPLTNGSFCQYDADLFFRNDAYANAATFKTAMSGVMLIYKISTPTTESADPFTQTQVVDNFGTEEYVDAGNRDVSIPVGHETKYLQDLRAKLESAPNSPDGDGDYIVRQTSGGNAYAPLAPMMSRKADIDGSYDDMTVGNSKQLVSTVGITDKVPYVFRTSGGSADIGDREEDTVVGGTVAWNQMAAMEATHVEQQLCSIVSSTETSVTFQTESSIPTWTLARYTKTNRQIVIGHKYLLSIDLDVQTGGEGTFILLYGNTSSATTDYLRPDMTTTGKRSLSVITNARADATNGVIFAQTNITSITFTLSNAQLFDLTQMFGSTIADYIYSLEQSTAGAGVAYFRKLFPKPYYSYNAGSLESVQTSAHEMTGFNQWDGVIEQGAIDVNTGKNTVNADISRTKNYIPVIPNTTYCYTNSLAQNIRLVFYGYDKSCVGHVINNNSLPQTFTTPNNAYYIRFYASDISKACINLHWDGERDGEYEPYVKYSYPLDSSLTLRGIPKLDASNNLYYDGDTYEADGTVERRYGVVDLGTLTWTKDSFTFGDSSEIFYAAVPNAKGKMGINGTTQICSKYVSSTDLSTDIPDKSCRFGVSSTNINIFDSTLSGKTVNEVKTAMSGVYLVYELAEPTTEEAEPFQTPQIVDDFGTEEYVDIRDVAVPVGHETIYRNNLRAKLEMAPESPDGNGDYVVRQTNGVNEYVPLVIPAELPTNPSENGTYVLQATVSGGTTTLSWVSQ